MRFVNFEQELVEVILVSEQSHQPMTDMIRGKCQFKAVLGQLSPDNHHQHDCRLSVITLMVRTLDEPSPQHNLLARQYARRRC